jgi:hypothetical protein
MARSLAVLGDFNEAIGHGDEAIRLADSIDVCKDEPGIDDVSSAAAATFASRRLV